jgi:ribosomal protein S18 acetylase RimI-like enzyme
VSTWNIHPAELRDLQACLALDHSYRTDHVWQMDVQKENSLVGVAFRTMRLPRPVRVEYPRDAEALLADWHRRDCFLVATAPQGDKAPIVGYLTMAAHDWHKTGWVADLVVAPEHRRLGVATCLLQTGKEWARQAGLHRLTIETQTKNYPAIRFLERMGFAFCGYNDHYYAGRDIALFFALDLY